MPLNVTHRGNYECNIFYQVLILVYELPEDGTAMPKYVVVKFYIYVMCEFVWFCK